MTTAWYRLNPTRLPRGIVAIDATAESAGLWFGPILSILEEFATQWPEQQQPEVVFLGDQKLHPLAAILRGLSSEPASRGPAAVRVSEQLGRYPVIGPLLWSLARTPDRPILLMAGQVVVDLVDWALPEVMRRLLVYRLMGEEAQAPEGFRELDTQADLALLVEHLADAVRSVRLGGGAAMVLDWDNAAYRWTEGTIGVDGNAEFTVTAQITHPDGALPSALATRSSGAAVRLELERVAAPPPPTPPLRLTASEGTFLGLWRGGKPYYCMGCNRSHPPGQLRCDQAAEGPTSFPTLASFAPGTLGRVAYQPAGWLFRPIPRGVTALADGRVAALQQDTIAAYSQSEQGWQLDSEPLDAFPEVGEGEYLLRT